MSLITLADIQSAARRIAPIAHRTPLLRLNRARLRMAGFPELADTAPDIYLKDESAQPIGSFKLRGAYNKIAQLSPAELKRGVITYSSGNHAQGVAYAARALGTKAIIVMPSNAPRIKREATLALGAEVVEVGPASTERKEKAEALAALHGYTLIPPYDDPAIIAGQATCGLEIREQLGWSLPQPGENQAQLPHGDLLILSPVSGGGLLSGVATAIKLSIEQQNHTPRTAPQNREPQAAPQNQSLQASPQNQPLQASPQNRVPQVPRTWGPGLQEAKAQGSIQIYGCEPALAADAAESFRTRTLTEWPAADTTRTLCDGLRTQSLGALNFDHILHFADGIVTLPESEIRTATRLLLEATKLTPEPSGAITLAAALFHAHELPPAKKIVAILSGGNLDPALRAELESEAPTLPL